MSTTGTKKELIDFLWEWAESNGDWSKLLVNNIIAREKPLLSSERQLIFDYFLQSIQLNKGLPDLEIKKPLYSPSSKKISLQSLSEVRGVNKLAEDQIINFGRNITIIYGENGSGKTGYCRILKSLGFSYDTKNAIFSNINETKIPQSAHIKYLTNEVENALIWDGAVTNIDLSTISVFNNNCVQVSLGDGRGLIVSPMGFHLFNLVVDELNELNSLINTAISSRPTNLEWSINLHSGTPQSNFIASLNDKTSDQALIDLSNFSADHLQELTTKQDQLKRLNRDLLQSEIRSFSAHIMELNTSLAQIELTKNIFNKTVWTNLLSLNKCIEVLESKTKKGIKEIAESKGIGFYNTNEFQNFIKSADLYIQLLNKPNYPNGDSETCVYCRQELANDEAIDLLNSYRQLLNDTTQEEITALRNERASMLNQINTLQGVTFHQDTFGLDEKQAAIQPAEVTKYNKDLATFKELIASDKLEEKTIFNLDYDSIINCLKKHLNVIIDKHGRKTAIVSNIVLQEDTLKSNIAELKDRKLLTERTEEVKKVMVYLKVIARLEKNRNKFSTNSISRKTTEAREELVKQNFIDIFNSELKSFRKTAIKIELSFGTSKGTSKVQQKINSCSLFDILSEGEQKAIALAEYLTELQLDNSKSPVILMIL